MTGVSVASAPFTVLASWGMPWSLPWPFERTYMQLALVAGLAVGIAAPLIGTFVVQRHMSLIGDGIGHVAVAGVGAGLLFGWSPTWAALGASVLAALAVEWLRSRNRASGDLALAIIFYGGIAAGVVFASRSTSTTNLQPYLFGSILTVSHSDVALIIGLAVAIIVIVLCTRRALFSIVLDEEAARVDGIPVGVLNAALAALIAVTVVAAMNVVGVLLIAALMVLPVATSRLVARSFTATMFGASLVGAVSVAVGLWVSRVWGLASGGTIVLTTVVVFAIASVVVGVGRGAARGLLDEH